MRFFSLAGIAIVLLVSVVAFVPAQVPVQAPDGAALFQRECASCHLNPAPDSRAPNREALRGGNVDAIVATLTSGGMALQGARLSVAERRAVAEFLTSRPAGPAPAVATASAGRCTQQAAMTNPAAGTHWNGWGAGVANTRFQPADQSGMTPAQVPNLKLKWAFGVEGVTVARAQPAVAGGRLFVGSDNGTVYALDAKTGCTYWTFRAQAGIRGAMSAGARRDVSVASYAVYFTDIKANAYALDAATGAQIWVRNYESHPAVRVTGSPTLHEGRLYVTSSGVGEENSAAQPNYECCTFRGSVSAIDTVTGAIVWKAYTIQEEPKPRGKSTTGAQLYGPAGAGVWSAPTIDAKRGLVYVGTGNGYADPPQSTTDAVVAFDLQTGKLKWTSQLLAKDNWAMGCPGRGNNPNCPETVGPDYDFSASPVLATTAAGRDLIVIPQKSGLGFALDPDKEGAMVWQYRAGRGSAIGGVWGAAVDREQAYFAVADQRQPQPGGVHAVNLETGARAWFTPPKPPLCGAGAGCSAAQSAALTAMPGVVFSGSADGGVRAYSSKDGAIIWEFNTNRDFETVNGVKAKGGSMDLGGPVMVEGMLYVSSGNGGIVGMPGNVILAFGVD